MVKRPRHLKASLLSCLLAAFPVVADSRDAPVTSGIKVARAASSVGAQHDPLIARFRDQNKLLDGILSRLSRIEGLVDQIQEMVTRFPGCLPGCQAGGAPPVAPPQEAVKPAQQAAEKIAPAQAPAPQVQTQPVTPAVKPPRPRPVDSIGIEEEDGLIPGFGSLALQLQIAGALLLLFAFFLWARKKQSAKTENGRRRSRANGAEGVLADFKEATAKPKRRPAPPPAPDAAAPKTPVPPEPPAPPTPHAPPPAPPSVSATMVDAAEPDIDEATDGDQALELAEMMLSMGLGQGAAQTLIEQIKQEPKQALRHWLKLLEVHRLNGEQEEFEKSAEELRKYFNVQPEDWQASESDHSSLLDFERITAQIVELWGKPQECLAFMQGLLDDNRGGARQGFPTGVVYELLLLIGMLKNQ